MSGRRSRNKGSSEERAVVNLHREMGLEAERTLEKGKRPDGSKTWDVDIIQSGRVLHGECKLRGNGFKQIYDWIEGVEFLTIRADRKERLYVVPEQIWIELLTLKEGRCPNTQDMFS